MEEDINVLLERLNFSEEESKRVISSNQYSTNPKGYKAWAVGKILKGVILVKFNAIDDITRILNLSPWLFDQCLFTLLLFDKDQGVQIDGTTQARGNWRNGIEILESKPNQNTETNDTTERSGDENDPTRLKQKEKSRIGEEDFESSSPIEKRTIKIIRDGGGRMRCKRKRIKGGNGENIYESLARLVCRKPVDNLSPWKAVAGDMPTIKLLCWNYRGLGNPATVRGLKQLLANNFSCVQNQCRMDGCLAVNLTSRSGGLAMLWKE
ncbi:hypothetical protein Goklo_016511 [Gossypium klotzschianum]|uniref:DUF4283 domain-containing protein n=1 Tax=Gossypium klotzschianum TaxID=34286 RepID=A0A7J8UEG5_9ROSI|nr:hypothetical protein [Gossypium klotzschianum]